MIIGILCNWKLTTDGEAWFLWQSVNDARDKWRKVDEYPDMDTALDAYNDLKLIVEL